jgi:hypothetical protein
VSSSPQAVGRTTTRTARFSCSLKKSWRISSVYSSQEQGVPPREQTRDSMNATERLSSTNLVVRCFLRSCAMNSKDQTRVPVSFGGKNECDVGRKKLASCSDVQHRSEIVSFVGIDDHSVSHCNPVTIMYTTSVVVLLALLDCSAAYSSSS